MSASLQRYLSAGVLTIWGVVLAHFYISGRLASYLHPSFHALTGISGVVLLLLAVGVLFLPAEDEQCSGPCCEHLHGQRRPARSVLAALILVVPLLAAALVSPDQFGAVVATNRGLIDRISDLPGYKPYVEPPLPTAADSQEGEGTQGAGESYLPKNEAGQLKAQTVDLIFAAEEPTMRADFEGKEVELIGQFMPTRAGNPEGDRFNLVRMFVICCAADARPVAITVQTDKAQPIAEMSWVRVRGKAAFPVESGRRVALVLAESVMPCDPPEETFIY
ncbi:MAG TPA: TIGR03943 family protein [Terrimicrobiaceae bacterium]